MRTCWHECAILVCLCTSLVAQSMDEPDDHPTQLTVLNGSGDGNYQAGETVSITATGASAGYVFLGWTILSKGGSINSWSEEAEFVMPDHSATVAAIYGKVETWFPPGDEDAKEGVLLPRGPIWPQKRIEQKIRVTFSLGDGANRVKKHDLWWITRVLVDWFPADEVQGTWGAGEITRCFVNQYGEPKIQRDHAIPKESFVEVAPGVFETSIWHESRWTWEQAAEKAGDDGDIVLPKLDIEINLGFSSNPSYFISRMRAQGALLPVEFEVIHTEIDPATGQAVNPGANTMLRDEIVDLRIKIPLIGATDWTVDLSVEPEAMRTQSLPNRGNMQMHDFGQIETNGTVTPDKTQFVLKASAGGERTIRAVFNKEGTLKVKMKSTDGKIDFTSPEYTIQKRIRKYANLPSSQNHDLNQHDQAFIDAAAHWGGVYQHSVDDVERLKAMGMAESELGLTDATDIMTVGNPGDHVLDTFRNVPPYDRFPGVSPLGGLALREVDIANNTTKMLSYPAADETPAATAIHWGVCWLYQKASSIQNNPNPPQPPNPPNPYIPGPWRSWDTATERYNGGGVPNYLQRINRSMKEGRHPSNANLYIWPLKSNKKARGNQ